MQIPQLTFLRFLAALGVVLFHFGQATAPFSGEVLLPVVKQAGLGVGFFFTLSGFLMAWVYGQKSEVNWKSYARARFARIAPLYWLSFLLALLAVLFILNERPRGFTVIMQAIGLQAWAPGTNLSVNFPAWSVSVELFLYVMFALLLLPLRRMNAMMKVGMALALYGLSFWIMLHIGEWTQGIIPNTDGDFRLRFPLWHLHSFVLGMVTGLLYIEGKLKLPGGIVPGLLFTASTALMFALAYYPEGIIAYAGNGLLAPLYLVMIVSLCQDRGPIAKIFSLPLFQFAGEMSYGVYLLQAPVYISLAAIAGSKLNDGWLWTYLAVLLAFSAIVYYYFERPMRRWLRGGN